RAMQQVQKILIQIVQAGFTFESHLQILAQDTFGNSRAPLSFFTEQRVAENQIGMFMTCANFFNFGHDVLRRTRAVGRRNSMRTIGAEFRTAPAREYRKGSIRRSNRTADGMTHTPLIE